MIANSTSYFFHRQLNQQMSISPTVVRTVPGDKIVTKKTSSSPNTLTSQAKIDHGFVAQVSEQLVWKFGCFLSD